MRYDAKLQREVGRRLTRLRELNLSAVRNGGACRSRYNERVYRYATRWAASARRADIARVLGLSAPNNADACRLIDHLLRATARDDRRLRHKHGCALKYAAIRKVRAERLIAYLAKRRGYNACAEQYRL